MDVLQKLYNNIISELQTTEETHIDSIISRRLLLSREKASNIRKGIVNGIRKYETAGREAIDYQSSFREKVATALTLIVGSELGYLEKITPEEAGVVASFLSDIRTDKRNFEKAKIRALQTGSIYEDTLTRLTQNAKSLLTEGEELSKDPMYNLIETTIKLFDRYGDSLTLNYERTINKVLEELFGELPQEERLRIEKEVRDFFERRRLEKEEKGTFVNDKDVEELFKEIVAFDGKGVRIPAKEERILLGLILYSHFEKFKPQKRLSGRDRIVLAALIGDVLYLIWLVKNQFSEQQKFRKHLREILSFGLKDAEDKKTVIGALKDYLLPVWGALGERTSVIEELAEEELDRTAEEYAVRELFGSRENFEKSREIISDFVESAVKELPENREEWLEKKFKEYPEIWQNEEEIKKTVRIVVEGEKTEEGVSQVERTETGKAKEVREKEKQETRSDIVEKGLSLSGEVSQISWTSATDKVIEEGNKVLEKYAERADSSGLHGELAEEWHARTFNIDAAVKGKHYRAEVFGRNTKNSVDIGIIDERTGKIVSRYQSKYGKDAKTTASYLEDGDYRGQKPLVPSDQVEEVTKIRTAKGRSPATDRLEYDGVESKPLSREEAERLKERIKKRKAVFSWDNVTYRDAFRRVAKDSARVYGITLLARGAYRLGRAIFSSNTSLKEELKKFLKEDLKDALIPALKTAITGGIIVAARKGLIKVLKNTPARTIASVVEVSFRSVDTIKKMIRGEISFKEGVKEIGKSAVSVAGGMVGFAKGAAIGAALGSVIPGVGNAIGAFVGGVVGGILSEKITEKVISVARTIKEKAIKAYNSVKIAFRSLIKGISKVFSLAFA